MGKLTEKAKYIDMYASLPSLSFGKDGKVYSRFGLLLTFLTVFIIGGMAIWIGIKIFGRQTPSFIQYQQPPQEINPQIQWNTDDFKFGLSLMETDENRLVSRRTAYVDAYTNTVIPLTEKKCEFSEIPSDMDFSCFDQEESTKGKTYLDSKGTWGFSFLYRYCTDTAKYDCYSQTDAEKELMKRNINAYLLYEDLLVDPFDYENPVTTTLSFVNEPVLLQVGTNIVIELNEIEFTSDNGWIFEDLKTIKKLKPTLSVKVSTYEMLGVQIKYGGAKTIYKRTYPKIQDFFAQISGFITIITPIFLILVSPYGNLRAVQHMTNEIYEIKLNKPDSPSPKKKKRQSSFVPSNASSPTPLSTESERNLLSQKTRAKSLSRAPSSQKSAPFAPHAALVIGGLGVGKLPAKEDIPIVPEENTTPLQLKTFEKKPTNPFDPTSAFKITPSEDNSPQKPLVEQEKACPQEEQNLETEKLDENIEPAVEYLENNDDRNPDDIEEEEDVPLRSSDPLEVPWQDWLRSFWKPNPEVQVLDKAKEHIAEAFDLVTLAKKAIEIDKLKACLFTHDQRVIFENLPSSVIVLNPDIDLKSPEAIKQYHWKDSFKGDEVALRKSYSRLKGTKNPLDQLLIRLYEDEFIDDGACL